jgi:hypothetical protein
VAAVRGGRRKRVGERSELGGVALDRGADRARVGRGGLEVGNQVYGCTDLSGLADGFPGARVVSECGEVGA